MRQRNVSSSDDSSLAKVVNGFWYSKSAVVAFLFGLFLVVQAVSTFIPSFQSPDEPNHLGRAYLLSKGEILLGSEHAVRGGNLDDGLLEYEATFSDPRWYPYRLFRDPIPPVRKINLGEDIQWSGKEGFKELANTALYFPALYAPQALALTIGKKANWSIGQSYRLARTFSLVGCLALLCAAALTYPMPPLAISIFVMPMMLFQMASSSLDPMAFSALTLATALVMRGADPTRSFSTGMHLALVVALFCVVNARAYLLPLTIAPALVFLYRSQRRFWISSIVLLCGSLLWFFLASRPPGGIPLHGPDVDSSKVLFFATHPASFFSVLYETITNPYVLSSYWYMIVGSFGWAMIHMSEKKFLGWQGIYLDYSVYIAFAIMLLTLVLIAMRNIFTETNRLARLFLVVAAIGSTLLIYVMSTSWNPLPPDMFLGIQGRYFIPVLILLSYALGARLSGIALRVSLFILLSMAILSVSSMSRALLLHYWTT